MSRGPAVASAVELRSIRARGVVARCGQGWLSGANEVDGAGAPGDHSFSGGGLVANSTPSRRWSWIASARNLPRLVMGRLVPGRTVLTEAVIAQGNQPTDEDQCHDEQSDIHKPAQRYAVTEDNVDDLEDHELRQKQDQERHDQPKGPPA
jgi:hypothetical protein